LSISIQHGKEVTIAILHEAQPHYKATSYLVNSPKVCPASELETWSLNKD
jgi:hypothetical protein